MKTRVLVGAVTATIAAGLSLEALAPVPGQALANVLALGVYLWVLSASSQRDAQRLVICAVLGFAGELFLCFGWGLYTYRLGNLPFYVPLGHALLFVAGLRLSGHLPRWFPPLVLGLSTLVVGVLVGVVGHSAELLWFGLFLAAYALGRDRRVCSVMLMMALALELAGTASGAWRWAAQVPYVGLESGNPPFAAGAFYCVLDLLVLNSTRLLSAIAGFRPHATKRGGPAPQRAPSGLHRG